MIIDLHCHSRYSHDNYVEPEELVRRAFNLGLDGVCFTEHYSYDCSWPIDRLNHPEGFLVLRAVEVSTDHGHLLVYGFTDDSWNIWGRNNLLKLFKVLEKAHEHEAICVPAHPFRGWESLGKAIYDVQGLDGLETHNGVNNAEQNRPALEAAIRLGLPSTGGSDSHYVEHVGGAVTEFDNPIKNTDDLVREIKAGRCRGLTPPLAVQTPNV